jgi:hypothetical protein
MPSRLLESPEGCVCRDRPEPNGTSTAASSARRWDGNVAAISKRPRSPAGEPMTLGNMRENGAQSLEVSCWLCHDRAMPP